MRILGDKLRRWSEDNRGPFGVGWGKQEKIGKLG